MLIRSISRDTFTALASSIAEDAFNSAAAWFADKDGNTIAVVQGDPQRRWGFVCLSKDGQGSYRSTRMAEGFPSRDIATAALHSHATHLG